MVFLFVGPLGFGVNGSFRLEGPIAGMDIGRGFKRRPQVLQIATPARLRVAGATPPEGKPIQ
jgi:hypothetical protein